MSCDSYLVARKKIALIACAAFILPLLFPNPEGYIGTPFFQHVLFAQRASPKIKLKPLAS